jgi:hypothetical protein
MALNRFLEARTNLGKALLVHNNYHYSFEVMKFKKILFLIRKID